MSLNETINALTENVADIRHKPALRSTLEAELMKMGYAPDEVVSALDDFYKVRVQ